MSDQHRIVISDSPHRHTTIVRAPRRGGKTTAMLKWAAEDPHRVIVCISESEVQRLWRFIEEHQLPLSRAQLIGPYNVRETIMGRSRAVELGVDNADIVLAYLLGAQVSVATFTKDDD